MTRYILTAITLLLLYACSNTNRQEKTLKTISNDTFLKELRDSTKTTAQILDKILPGVIAIAKADTTVFYFGNNAIDDDSIFRLLLVGKPLNRTTVLATEINLQDTSINFYMLNKDSWELIGSEKTNTMVYQLEFEDLDGDGDNEIVTSTARNMNGNTFREVYYFSNKAKTIKYAGSFSTDYVVNKDKKQIEETYQGSWYADQSKTLYEWRQEKLVPIRQIILSLDNPDVRNGRTTLEYYENATDGTGEPKLIFKKPYNDNNERQRQLWDNFFSRD